MAHDYSKTLLYVAALRRHLYIVFHLSLDELRRDFSIIIIIVIINSIVSRRIVERYSHDPKNFVLSFFFILNSIDKKRDI